MNSARNKILGRLRSNKPDFAELPSYAPLPLPNWSREERISHFKEKLESVHGEVHVVLDGNWMAKLQELCREKRIANLLYGPNGPLGPEISSAWKSEADDLPTLVSYTGNSDEWKHDIFFKIDASITSTRGGIAETGSMILWPTPEEPRSYSLVPPIHFTVLESDKLHQTFAETLEIEQWSAGLPTNALLISGPSKSADIEQTLAYGVHGPIELIALII